MNEGFLYCALNEIELCRPAYDIPTTKELDIFRKCCLSNKGALSKTSTRLEQQKICPGTQVTVVQGEYRGLIGEIINMQENEVSIFINSLNQVEQLLKDMVRLTFWVGDEVRVCNGIYNSNVGWVVDVQEHTVTIINIEKDMEVFT